MYIFYMILYVLCVHFFNIHVEHDVWYIYFTSLIVAATAVCVIDTLVYVLAYKITGFQYKIGFIGRNEMKTKHWYFRFVFMGLCLILSLTPVINLLHPLIIAISTGIVDWIRGMWDSAMQEITDIFMNWAHNGQSK